MHKKAVAGLVVAVALSFLLTACQDTKVRQENEQLKAQVLELQKELGDMGNRVDKATKTGDGLLKENAALIAENKRLKARHPGTKTSKPKRVRRVR
jgi:regulator of replication initiation timing